MMLCQMRDMNSLGNALAPNRRNPLQCTVKTSRLRTIKGLVVCYVVWLRSMNVRGSGPLLWSGWLAIKLKYRNTPQKHNIFFI